MMEFWLAFLSGFVLATLAWTSEPARWNIAVVVLMIPATLVTVAYHLGNALLWLVRG